MEEVKSPEKPPIKGILSKKSIIKHASTYGPSAISDPLIKKKKKKVGFIDRSSTTSLCTVFNYEQVDVIEDLHPHKSTTSCACLLF